MLRRGGDAAEWCSLAGRGELTDAAWVQVHDHLETLKRSGWELRPDR
jgi:hypothetical protein